MLRCGDDKLIRINENVCSTTDPNNLESNTPMVNEQSNNSPSTLPVKQRVEALLMRMTQDEKIGQLCQWSGAVAHIPESLAETIRQGNAGSVINEVCPDTANKLQRIAMTESRLGIPLLIGRDVIHGFKTIFPIPLGQAASWSPELIKAGAAIAAKEAKQVGVNWTFAPMIDISRDPRWGRIAESLGEDPYLCATLGRAMVEGFQGDGFTEDYGIAACAKHFCGYGAAESGKDYCTTNIPENEFRNVYMVPFKAAADAGVATFMASFSDIDGIPASGNQWLMKDVLKEEWQYPGFVVSDWESISQLMVHGLCEDSGACAKTAFEAGIDMEMASTTYLDNLAQLISHEQVDAACLNDMVSRILTVKFNLGLFDSPQDHAKALPEILPKNHLAIAKQAAIESCVLLKNSDQTLPLSTQELNRIAVIGPLAHDGFEQLGTWIFDGEEKHSVSVLQGIQDVAGEQCEVAYHRAMATTRSHQIDDLDAIKESVNNADVTLLILGEEAILSGEAHCRAEIDLPGCQESLISELASLGKPIVLVVLAGRPLTLETVLPSVDALLYAWHPGTMGGPAIAELLFGLADPVGRLPVTFPRKVGQIPIYYSQKQSGKPVTESNYVFIDDIPARAAQTSLGNAAAHLDTHFTPLFPFGFGLSWCQFECTELRLAESKITLNQTLDISVILKNMSSRDGIETLQLYIRDKVGSITRPAKELKAFKRVAVAANQSKQVHFSLTADDLAFYGRDKTFNAEPGHFTLWIGKDSSHGLTADFELLTEQHQP